MAKMGRNGIFLYMTNIYKIYRWANNTFDFPINPPKLSRHDDDDIIISIINKTILHSSK